MQFMGRVKKLRSPDGLNGLLIRGEIRRIGGWLRVTSVKSG